MMKNSFGLCGDNSGRQILRVLVLHNAFSPYRIPLFQALSKSPGYDFHFLFSSRLEEHRNWSFGDDLGINYRVLSGKKVISRHGTINLCLDIGEISSHYDVIVLNDHLNIPELTLQTYAKLTRTPVLRWLATTKNSLQLLPAVKVWGKRILTRIAEAILVTGTEAHRYAYETTKGLKPIYVCNNVVDNEIYKRARSIPHHEKLLLKKNLGLEGLVVSYFGQLVPRKGLDILLDSLKHNSLSSLRFSVLLIGDGPLGPEIEKGLHSSSNQNVVITGHVDPADLPAYYAVSDVVVLPSYVDTWGMVINEAMAAGVPVICSTGAGAYKDLVAHGRSGFVFEKGRVDELTSALKRLLTDDRLRETMSNEGDRILEQFNMEVARDQFLDAIARTSKQVQILGSRRKLT